MDVREDIKKKILAGDYWGGLGLAPTSRNPQVIAEVLRQKDKFNDLNNELDEAKNALTLAREQYEMARKVVKETLDEIRGQFGQAAIENPLYPKGVPFDQELWKSVTRDIRWKIDGRDFDLQKVKNACDLSKQTFIKEVARIGGIPVGADEMRDGIAKRLIFSPDNQCDNCNGSGRVELKGIEAARYALDHGLIEGNAAELANMMLNGGLANLGLNEFSGYTVEKPCESCSRKVSFVIPPNAREGWVVFSKSEKMAARIDAIENKTPTNPLIFNRPP